MSSDWFDVDKAGLAAMLERRSKSGVIFELVQNAWDAGATEVKITAEAIPGSPAARLTVADNSPEGWADLSDSFTMFKRSRRGADPLKRGRFCFGEKLVLSLCATAKIITMAGSVVFGVDGRRRSSSDRTMVGTVFDATIRLTREELAELEADACRLISPEGTRTYFNGQEIARPAMLAAFDAKLPTEAADEAGALRRLIRMGKVEAYAAGSNSMDGESEAGEILEMGIPVCAADFPWRLNVLQKVPLGLERDTVTDGFRRALQVAALNAMPETLGEADAAKPWASEALGDARVGPDAVKAVVVKRFGERAVVAVPGDPIANAQAAANGCPIISGGALSGDAWANVRKFATVPTTSQAFPTPKPAAKPSGGPATCPMCGQQIPG